MNIKLIAHTQLSHEFCDTISSDILKLIGDDVIKDSQVVALTAIRTCYSPNKPSEIVDIEGEKYFKNKATDGLGGTEADRLFRHITGSGHTSTLEHISYTFSVEGVSRALLAQLTRHRHLSFSVQSQRYVRMGSDDKIGGFEFVSPPSLSGKIAPTNDEHEVYVNCSAADLFEEAMQDAQYTYDRLRKAGVPAEDARMVLPNAAATNIVLTGNLRTILEFYNKRKHGKGAQWEVADLAEGIKDSILSVDSWLNKYFDY
ncbi:FAD-dependent thymidylate synthase [Paenibacillus sp. LK1]|uniref:FAD-dependent thymidylate synthase n=1 Tax=Paenibacillus sp. LK1 TaxID=2053014 RepID=UPI000C174EB0|nr:FAD-dependent thymidylate synthase [Paenibacillus sp. LK1]PIH59022.1 thymidylate synthase (FAD) [Paenibacillus sp. LK1]